MRTPAAMSLLAFGLSAQLGAAAWAGPFTAVIDHTESSPALLRIERDHTQVNVLGGVLGDPFNPLRAGRDGGTPSTGIEINVLGGVVAAWSEHHAGVRVNVRSGTLETGASFGAGSSLSVHGGWVGGLPIAAGTLQPSVVIGAGARADVHGGSVDAGAQVWGELNVFGGSLGADPIGLPTGLAPFDVETRYQDSIRVRHGGVVNVYGGLIGQHLRADDGAEVNLFVLSASLDGAALGLGLGGTRTIDLRGGAALDVVLADGSRLGLVLDETGLPLIGPTGPVQAPDYVSSGALLTVTLVPAPGSAALLGMCGLLAARRRR